MSKITLTEEQINDLIDALPKGFAYDWTMTWEGADGNTYETSGPNEGADIPDEKASKSAIDYETKVSEAQADAEEHERWAEKALREGDADTAFRMIREAASEEREFGDAPTYQDVLGIIDRIEEAAEDDAADREDIAETIARAADAEGVIQAEDTLALTSDPTMHTACHMTAMADHLGVRAELDALMDE